MDFLKLLVTALLVKVLADLITPVLRRFISKLIDRSRQFDFRQRASCWLDRKRSLVLVNKGKIQNNIRAGAFVAAVEAGGLGIALSITGLDPFRELIAYYQNIGWI